MYKVYQGIFFKYFSTLSGFVNQRGIEHNMSASPEEAFFFFTPLNFQPSTSLQNVCGTKLKSDETSGFLESRISIIGTLHYNHPTTNNCQNFLSYIVFPLKATRNFHLNPLPSTTLLLAQILLPWKFPIWVACNEISLHLHGSCWRQIVIGTGQIREALWWMR